MTPILLDTSVIVALLDRSQKEHAKCVVALGKITAQLITVEAVIAESCYLLQGVYGARERVIQNVASGAFAIPFRLADSAIAITDLMKKYHDIPADLADACLIQLANDYKTPDILTLDGDFHIYRWGRNKPFHLLV